MSMLSAQCDRLRERAKELRNLAPDPTVPYIVPSTKETMALAMHSAASEMGDAADNIWELRCKLNDEQDENAKLRELVALMYCDMQGVLDMSTDTVWVDDVGTLRDEMDCHMQAMAKLGMPPADYERRMRELGMEVE